jgi:hypothetical protein
MSAVIENTITGQCLLTTRAGREYRLVFDMEAVAEVEAMSGGVGIMDLLMRQPGVTMLVRMFVAGSKGYARRNPGARPINPTLAMKLIRECGGLQDLSGPVAECVCRAEGMGLFDVDEDGEGRDEGDDEGGGGNDPPVFPGSPT